MTVLHSDAIERKLLAFFFKKPYHMRLLRIDINFFTTPASRTLAGLLQAYINRYKQVPTQDTITLYSNELVARGDDLDQYSDALMLMAELPKVQDSEFNFCFEKANNYYTGRRIFDILEGVKNEFSRADEVDFKNLRGDMLNKLLTIATGDSSIHRGFIYSNVRQRWQRYKYLENGGKDTEVVPFGISVLDDQLGGMRKGSVTLLYSRTSAGKTRTAVNFAYNAARAGHNVVFLSREMEYDLVASCFDSRMAGVDSRQIIFGKLKPDDREKYRNVLRRQVQEELGVWIVDIPDNINSIGIIEELETYEAITGKKADELIVDYANLIDPRKKGRDRSDQYGNLFSEFHDIARSRHLAMLTITLESRELTKALKDDKNKGKNVKGVEGIGLSNQIAPHCSLIMYLEQSEFDVLQNRMFVHVNKDRYGKANYSIPLFALWANTYVGDRKVTGVRVRKEAVNNVEESADARDKESGTEA